MNSTIVIPTCNGRHYLEKCLKSLAKEDTHIVVIDNGSTDGTFDLVADDFPEVEYISFSVNTGFCRAVNAGIVATTTKYVIFLNNDTIVEPGFVRELEAVMEQDERIFSASAKMISMKDKSRIDDAGDLYCALGWAFALGKGRPEKEYRTGYSIFAACGGAAIYRMAVFEQIGMLDENHFAYLEDIDLGYRARIQGYYNIYIPEAVVYHAGSGASGSRYNKFKVDLTSRNSIYLIYKNMPVIQIILNFPLLFAGFAVKTLFFLRKGMGADYLKGLGRGCRLCVSEEGRKHKVRFRRKHLHSYVRIQLELWRNICYRVWK